ncbi:MAG: hypothetical protein AAGE52_20400 [Myxococcota bacterium]
MRLGWAFALVFACGGSSGGSDSGTTDTGASDTGDTGTPDAGASSHDAFDVQSADGRIVLRVAANSLPAGVSPGDIEVIDGVEGTVESEDGLELFRGVTLLPDGVTFSEPAELEVRAPLSGAVAGILVSGDTVEPISLLLGDDSIIAEIPHFSDAILVQQPDAVGQIEVLRDFSDTIVEGLTEAVVAPMPSEGEIFTGVYFRDGIPRPIRFGFILDLTYRTIEFRVEDLERVEEVTGTAQFRMLPAVWEPRFRCTEAGTMTANVRARVQSEARFTDTDQQVSALIEMPPAALSGECIAAMPDNRGDCGDSLGPSQECTFFDAFIDIAGAAARRETLNEDGARGLFGNTAYPCNLVEDGVRTVCAADPAEFPSGAMWTFRTELSAPVPDGNPTHSLIYALVLESDLDPENDWVPRDPFIWDYFQGADRWYQLEWDHLAREWSVTATQVDSSQNTMEIPTAARVVISNSVITWYIPTSEVDRPTPDYRLTAFAHDGRFSESDRGGDVTGGDPTAPLLPTTP